MAEQLPPLTCFELGVRPGTTASELLALALLLRARADALEAAASGLEPAREGAVSRALRLFTTGRLSELNPDPPRTT